MTGAASAVEAERAARAPKKALIFTVSALALVMVSIDQTVVSTALTTLQRELGSSIEWVGWTLSIYSLGSVVVMPIAGKLSDMYGRKRIFLAALVLFTLSSLACGLSQNIYELIAFRLVQAVGGGAFMPSASGLVADHFGSARDRAIGMFTSIFPIGAMIGPIVGGLFVAYGSWRGIFLINIPIGAALFLLGLFGFPRDGKGERRRLDGAGIVLLALFLLSLMLGITWVGEFNDWWTQPLTWVAFAVAAVALPLFIRHIRRVEAPFVPPALVLGRHYAVMNLLNMLLGAGSVGFGGLLPLYAQERFHFSPLESGTLVTARAIGMIAVTAVATFAMRRTGVRLPIAVGSAIAGGSLIALSFSPPPGASLYWWLAGFAAITGLGMGMAIPASNNASLHLAPGQVAGVSGLRGMFRQSGSILVVSITTAAVNGAHDTGAAFGVTLLVLGALLIVTIPLLRFVPDHRGSW